MLNNIRVASDLRRHDAYCDITVMSKIAPYLSGNWGVVATALYSLYTSEAASATSVLIYNTVESLI